MAGINTTGQADTNDYNIGRGKVYFAPLDSAGTPLEYRFLGNAPEFSISMETETLEHQSSTDGLKVVDKEVTISQKANLSLTLDEINFGNMALFFSGEVDATYDNTVGGSGIVPHSGGNLTLSGLGRWYDLYQTTDGAPSSDHADDRAYDLGALTVEDDAGGTTTYVLGTDYLSDLKQGRIFILSTGSIGATDTLWVASAANGSADVDMPEVRAMTQTTIAGALKFISENPADSDHETEYQFHQVSLKAEGDFGLISDEYTQMSMTGVAERNTTASTNSPTLTIRTHDNA